LANRLWHKCNQTAIAAYNVFIVSATGAAIAKCTGEGAQDALNRYGV